MRKKVLIIQSTIPHYRVSVFNELAKHVDLTVVYNYGVVPENVNFSICKVEVKKWIFHIHQTNILQMAKQYDVVIMMMNYSFLTTWILSLFCKSARLILWGIGVSAGYDERYDENEKVAKRLIMFLKRADAALFYSDYPVHKYAGLGIPKEKMFVANNTVEVMEIEQKEKTDLLFVGTLYKEKKIYELLNSYYEAYLKDALIPNLTIVGNGEEFDSVQSWIREQKLEQKISLAGAVFDEEKLSQYFAKALVCISPDQAGLSVLKSFGYGVPFATHKNAITGGERMNIIDGKTGVLFDSFSQIKDLIHDCSKNKQKYVEMGHNAKTYYYENRTVSHMVQGFIDAIEYVSRR